MATDPKLHDTISKWLEAKAPGQVPDRVLRATFERTRRTRQHVGWRGLLGRIRMIRFLPALGGAAVVATAALLALTFPPRQPGIGGPATHPPTASPSPTFSGPPSDCVDLWADGGSYRATVGAISVEATVPAGWHGGRDQFYLVNSYCGFGGSLQLEVASVTHVYTNACRWRGTEVEAPTPAALTAALAAQEGHEASGPTDVTIGGYPASRFEFSFPADFDDEACDDGTMWLFPGGPDSGIFNIDPGTNLTVSVVDVDGMTVVAVASLRTEDATAADRPELDAIVASLRFQPSRRAGR